MPPATVNLVRIPGISFTLLEFAARNGQLQVVEVLLSFGADVNIQTPCLWAAYTGNIEIIERLVQHGAVPSRERGFDGVSRSPFALARTLLQLCHI
jgi:ankyrin repeat protein